jgi:hypothetical protein
MKRLNAYYNSERFLLRFLMIDSCLFVLALTFWLTHS